MKEILSLSVSAIPNEIRIGQEKFKASPEALKLLIVHQGGLDIFSIVKDDLIQLTDLPITKKYGILKCNNNIKWVFIG